MDAAESIDSVYRIGTAPKHCMRTPHTETGIVVKVDGTVKVQAHIDLVFRSNGHTAVCSDVSLDMT